MAPVHPTVVVARRKAADTHAHHHDAVVVQHHRTHDTHPHVVTFIYHQAGTFDTVNNWVGIVITLFLLLSAGLFGYIEMVGVNFVNQWAFAIVIAGVGGVGMLTWLITLIYYLRNSDRSQFPYSWRHRWVVITHWIVAAGYYAFAVAALFVWVRRSPQGCCDRYPVEDFVVTEEWWSWLHVSLYNAALAGVLLYVFIKSLVSNYFSELEQVRSTMERTTEKTTPGDVHHVVGVTRV